MDWRNARTGVPTQAETARLCDDWDYAQCNDFEISEADPFEKEVGEAFTLRKADPAAGFVRLLELAERGSVWAMFHVAYCYWVGRGINVDEVAADNWYRRSAEGGCDQAILDCGRLRFARGDLDGAAAIYALGAARGFAPAMMWLAWAGTKRSPTREAYLKSRALLEQAVTLGSPGALRRLAHNACRGRYGLRQIPHGIRLMRKFSRRFLTDFEKWKATNADEPRSNLSWFEGSALRGFAPAQYRLAELYLDGLEVPQDYGLAISWLEKAAAQGDMDARYRIGTLYLEGLGVPKDAEVALAWFTAAAQGGNAWAQVSIGNLYLEGVGVNQDYDQARIWFEKAAAQGNPTAEVQLGYLLASGLGVPVAYEAAMKWFRKAAAQSDGSSQAWIGWLYLYGLGVVADRNEAWSWFEKAAANGEPIAEEWLAKLRH